MAFVTRASLHLSADASDLKRGMDVAKKAYADQVKVLDKAIDSGQDYSKQLTSVGRAERLAARTKKQYEQATGKADRATKRFTKSTRDAKRSVDSYGSSVGKAVTGLKGLAAAAGVGIAVRGMFRAVEESAQLGTQLLNTSKALGVTVEQYQGLQKVFRDTGGTSEQMTTAMRTFQTRAGQAATSATNAFRRHAIQVREDTRGMLADVATLLESSAPELRLAIASEFFGEEGGARALAALGAGMESFLERFDAATAGAGISTAEATRLNAVNTALEQFRDDWSSSVGRLVAEQGPQLIHAFEQASQAVLRFAEIILGRSQGAFGNAIKSGVGWGAVGGGTGYLLGTAADASQRMLAAEGQKTIRMLTGMSQAELNEASKFGRRGLDLAMEARAKQGLMSPDALKSAKKYADGMDDLVKQLTGWRKWIGKVPKGKAAGKGLGLLGLFGSLGFDLFWKSDEAKEQEDLNRLIKRLERGTDATGTELEEVVKSIYSDLVQPAAARMFQLPPNYLTAPHRLEFFPGHDTEGSLFQQLLDFSWKQNMGVSRIPGVTVGGTRATAAAPAPQSPPFEGLDPGRLAQIALVANDYQQALGGFDRDMSLLSDAQLTSLVARGESLEEVNAAGKFLEERLRGDIGDAKGALEDATKENEIALLRAAIARQNSEAARETLRGSLTRLMGERDQAAAEQAAEGLVSLYLKLGDLGRLLVDRRAEFPDERLILDPLGPSDQKTFDRVLAKREEAERAAADAQAATQQQLADRVARTEGAFRGLADALFQAIEGAVSFGEAMRQFFVSLLRDIGSDIAGSLGRSLATSLLTGSYATGGFAGRGWAMVGEQGPELVNFATPGRVYSNQQLGNALRGRRGDVNLSVSFNVAAGSDAMGFRTQAPQIADVIRGVVEEATTRPGGLGV